MKVTGRIKCIHKILCGEEIWYFDNLSIQNNGSTNVHLKEIQGFLMDYFFPMNHISKKKRSMRCLIKKPHALPMKRLAAHLT